MRFSILEVEGFRDEWIVLIRCKEASMDLYAEIKREPNWCNASRQQKPVRLVLDGLDEGFLREPAYFDRLKRTLQILRSENPALRLLLACRPGERDEAFENAVHSAWQGNGKPHIFALEPLSLENRNALSKYCGVEDVAEFNQWIQRNKFEEFAAWPRSLEWLADEFIKGDRQKINYTRLCQLRVSRSFGEDKRLLEAGAEDRAEEWSQAIMLIAATPVF